MTALAAVLAVSVVAGAAAQPVFPERTARFLRKIEARPLALLAAQYRGRVAVLDTVARDQLSRMTGRADMEGLPPAVAYLELYFNAGHYLDAPVLRVRAKNMRQLLARELAGHTAETLRQTHRLPPACLLSDLALRELLAAGRADLAQCVQARDVPSLGPALGRLAQQRQHRLHVERLYASYSAFLGLDVLRLVPVPRGDWPPAEFWLRGESPAEEPFAVPASARALGARLVALRDAWRARDAETVNRIAAELSEALPQAADYPHRTTRQLECIYNRTYGGTPLWSVYAVSLLLLLLAVASGRSWARRWGLAVFALATALSAIGFVARWIISGRAWYLPPMMNQWEAVTSSALLGAVLALVLELIWKRNYLALAAALYATTALLCGQFLLDPRLTATHGLLSSRVMAIHVSVIIVGHALVGMTFFISVVYLLVACWRGLAHGPASAPPDLHGPSPQNALAVIDRCNLIVAQLACWTVVLGTILGAYWADIAWARWWGWDRKETWALLTAIVYVVALHVRFVTSSRRRGLVTAIICIVGCAVMMFNWIVVNFFLAGMHSYA